MDSTTLSVEDGIAVLTLNRPDSLNAMSQAMVKSLESRLVHLATLPGLRVVILTGAGRAFSAGGDLVEFEQALNASKQTLLEYLGYNMGVLQRLEDLPVPVIGAVNGTAVAGGLETLLCCDILIAAEGARIGDGHVRYGIVPAAGATVRLGERISPSRASELFYTARLVEAATLRDWGLINEVVPPGQLMSRAMEIARDISRHSPEAVAHIKFLTGKGARTPERQSRIATEIARFALHVDGRDLARGLSAFKLKQPVHY
ncbi:MAG: enoyl-CoA hydratase/isomerase family protein [Hoeflea sp.]|nr:enoyl-CoA hydratase/isomerase family protein [Hoeflea sp.]